MDRPWWELHRERVALEFKGEKFSTNPLPTKFGVTKLGTAKFKAYGNSGAAAISLAAFGGAKREIMLGFDCQKTDGKAHWHGDHPAGLGNCAAINRWLPKFREMAHELKHVEIINASRQTALDCFPRMSLEQALSLE